MGLDVYSHKTKIAFDGDQSNINDFSNFTEKVNKQAQSDLRTRLDEMLVPLRDAWEKLQTNDYWRNIYNERYFTFVEQLRPIVAKNYDWMIYPYTEKILDLPELEAQLDKEVKNWFEPYDAYFRKVNFLYKYYEDRGKMYDQYYAFTDIFDIDDIIDRCVRVLADRSLANELLPTQEGFFFGSTEYDEYYFSDVQDCLRQMKEYRKLLTDGVTGYVIFSW